MKKKIGKKIKKRTQKKTLKKKKIKVSSGQNRQPKGLNLQKVIGFKFQTLSKVYEILLLGQLNFYLPCLQVKNIQI